MFMHEVRIDMRQALVRRHPQLTPIDLDHAVLVDQMSMERPHRSVQVLAHTQRGFLDDLQIDLLALAR